MTLTSTHSIFSIVFFICSLVLAIGAGTITTLQIGIPFSRFGLLSYIPHLISLSLCRELVGTAVGLSFFLAMIFWAHRVENIEASLFPGKWSLKLLGSILFFPVFLAFAGLASFITAYLLYGIGWRIFYSGWLETIVFIDLAVGWGLCAFSVGILGIVSRFFLPLLNRLCLPLLLKIILCWIPVFLLWFMIEFVFSTDPLTQLQRKAALTSLFSF